MSSSTPSIIYLSHQHHNRSSVLRTFVFWATLNMRLGTISFPRCVPVISWRRHEAPAEKIPDLSAKISIEGGLLYGDTVVASNLICLTSKLVVTGTEVPTEDPKQNICAAKKFIGRSGTCGTQWIFAYKLSSRERIPDHGLLQGV